MANPESKDPYKEGYADLYNPKSSKESTDPATAQKIRDEKLKTIGQICAAIDHWMRTPLAGITSALALIEMESETLTPEAREAIADIDGKVRAIDSIIQRIKEMAKPGEAQIETIDPAQLIENALILAGYEISTRKTKVHKEITTGSHKLEGSKIQLEQVLYQLIKNACEAMGSGGTVTIRTSHLPTARQIQIEVADTGPGIAKELLQGTMGMFFSTKKVGVGMGLFISHLVVQAHSGQLTVESDTGKGAAFTIRLPEAA